MYTQKLKTIQLNDVNSFIDIANEVGMLNSMFGNQSIYLSTIDKDDPESEIKKYCKPIWKQRRLIVEEAKEIIKAYDEGNHEQVLDGIGDFLTVYYGEHYINSETDATVYSLPTGLINQQSTTLDWCVAFERSIHRLERFIVNNEDYPLFYKESLSNMGEEILNQLFRTFLGFTETYLRNFYCAPISIKEIYDCVHLSNMTKFFTPEQQLATVEFYENKGYPVEKLSITNVSENRLKIYVRESFELDGKHFPEGKFLKGIDFTEPDFERILSFLNHLQD